MQRSAGASRSRSPRPGSIGKGDNSQMLQQQISSAYAIEEISENNTSMSKSSQSDRVKSSHSRSPVLSRSQSHSRSAWHTPRGETPTSAGDKSLRSGTSQRNVSPTKSANSNNGKVSVSEWYGDRLRTPPEIVCSTPDVKFDKQLPPSQADALSSIKQMIAKEKLSSLQTRTLDSVRMALQQINEDQENLSNQQLERTLTIISLASQLTEESLQLGVFPDSIFDTFAALNSRAMSDMTHGEDDYSIDDGSVHMADFLRPITKSTMGDEVCLCLLPWQHFLFSLQDMQFFIFQTHQ